MRSRIAQMPSHLGVGALLSTALLLMAVTACTSTQRHGGGTATIEFVHPEKFTDIELRGIPPERTRELILPDLANYIQKQAGLHIPAGEHLQMQITDIDEAGWIRPIGPVPRRIVRQSQPARVDFNYTLTDASGNTLDSGTKTLSDVNMDRMDRSFDYEQLPLIKRMLGDWIAQIGTHGPHKTAATGGTR